MKQPLRNKNYLIFTINAQTSQTAGIYIAQRVFMRTLLLSNHNCAARQKCHVLTDSVCWQQKHSILQLLTHYKLRVIVYPWYSYNKQV